MQYIIIAHFKRNANKYKTCINCKVVKRNLRIFPLFFCAHCFDENKKLVTTKSESNQNCESENIKPKDEVVKCSQNL